MKTLLILRHAKSSWSNLGLADHDRPLSKRGKSDAPRMGQLLSDEDLIPDLIISSTAKRARQTAELVADACGYEGELMMTRYFYHGGPEEYIDGMRVVPDDCDVLMIVGHNPGMEELLDVLTQESAYLTTANIARVILPIQNWRELDEDTEGTLADLWRPKELD